jgi:uridine phosphorylase
MKRRYAQGNDELRHIWDVERIWKLAEELEEIEIDIAEIVGLDSVTWFHEGGDSPTVRSVAAHAKRIMQADTGYQPILTEDFRVFDGMHRIARHLLDGKKKILVKKFVKNPEPDIIEGTSLKKTLHKDFACAGPSASKLRETYSDPMPATVSKMSRVTLLEFDPETPAFIEPSEVLKKLPDMPQHCVICFFNDVIESMEKQGRLQLITRLKSEIGYNPIYLIKNIEKPVALLHPGVGAPLAVGFLEEAIALGADRFIACGGAGSLKSTHQVGKLIVPTRAIRDEGASFHYLAPEEDAVPTENAFNAIIETMKERGVDYECTLTWTTDGIYRETRRKIEERRNMGCGAVEMEAAALFAVASFRKVELAQILYAGDDLSGEFWDSRNWHSKTEVREKLLDLAIAACVRL